MNQIFKISALTMCLFLAACGSKKDSPAKSKGPTLEEKVASCAAPYQTASKGTEIEMKSFFSGRNGKWNLQKLEIFQETKDSKAHAYIGYTVIFDRSFSASLVSGCSGQPGVDINGKFSYAFPAELSTDRVRYESEIQGTISFNPKKGEQVHTSVVDRRNVPFSFEVKPGRVVSAKKLEDNSVEVLVSVTEKNADGVLTRSLFKANYLSVPDNHNGRDDRDGRGGRGGRDDREGRGDRGHRGDGSRRDEDGQGDRNGRNDRDRRDDEDRPGNPPDEVVLEEARKYAKTSNEHGGLGLKDTREAKEVEAFVDRLRKMPDWVARIYLQVHRKTFLFATSDDLGERGRLSPKLAIRLANQIAGKRQAELAFQKFSEAYRKAVKPPYDGGLGLSRSEAYEITQKAIAEMPNRRF